ncbi:sensor domain-containing diguanylate cyclase [Pediococcus cellicola]|uniref:GGDEF domain-containing protein n=1 Tax=Pediococcus cellicola TaxID=319652 RepID=UPI00070B86B6|nr:GGDEF domain-containing protein [Pediococcus cellicola]GEL15096.1 GGDEF domain-containing protein [Pediococcus cellicola]
MTQHVWLLSPLFTGIFVTLGVVVFFQILARMLISHSGSFARPLNYLSGRLATFSVIYFSVLAIYFEIVVARYTHDLNFVDFRLLLLFYVTIYLNKRSSVTIILVSSLMRIYLWGFSSGTLLFFLFTWGLYTLILGLTSISRKLELRRIYLIGLLDVFVGGMWLLFAELKLPYFGTISTSKALYNWFSFVVMNAVLEFGITHLNAEDNYLTLLSQKATTDPLTKLSNYLAFKEEFASQYAKFYNLKTPLTMVAIDIDYFKRVNDDYGHLAGNVILKAIAKIILTETAKVPEAKAYRVGGEEFNILLPNMDLKQAGIFSHRIQDRVRYRIFTVNDEDLRITLSMGVAQLQTSDISANLFYERADQMLYHSKGQGRNQISLEPQQDKNS